MLDLSIIIPVFNGERFIDRCFSSIYSSGMPENKFEIIAVDDCSKDNSVEILENWARSHSNLTVLKHETNRRQGAARNTALRVAQGKYVYFVDVDDYVTDNLPIAMKSIMTIVPDVCVVGVLKENENGNIKRFAVSSENRVISKGEFIEKYYGSGLIKAPSNFIYRRGLLTDNGLFFRENVLFEDTDWVEKTLLASESIYMFNKDVYVYKWVQGSTCNSKGPVRDANALQLCYYRMKTADTIEDDYPCFAEVIRNDSSIWVKDILGLRHLSKFSPKELSCFFSTLGKEPLNYFCQKDTVSGWVNSFVSRHKGLGVFVMNISYPITHSVRLFRSFYRKVVSGKLV